MTEKAVREVLRTLSSDPSIHVFPTRTPISEDAVIWDGDDPAAFVDFARRASVDLIYSREVVLEERDAEGKHDLEKRVGQPFIVEIGFYRNGLWHVFDWTAEWAEELNARDDEEADEEEEESGEVPSSADWDRVGKELAERRTELVSAFIDHISKSDEIPSPDSEWELRPAFLQFLSERLALPRIAPPTNRLHFLGEDPAAAGIPKEVEKTLRATLKDVATAIRIRERAAVDLLIPKCAKWVVEREIGLRTFSLAKVSEFLEEDGSHLSRSGRSDLWSRTILAVKRDRPGRQGGSHH